MFGKELDFSSGIEFLLVAPVIGWLNLREQWTKKEDIDAMNVGTFTGPLAAGVRTGRIPSARSIELYLSCERSYLWRENERQKRNGIKSVPALSGE